MIFKRYLFILPAVLIKSLVLSIIIEDISLAHTEYVPFTSSVCEFTFYFYVINNSTKSDSNSLVFSTSDLSAYLVDGDDFNSIYKVTGQAGVGDYSLTVSVTYLHIESKTIQYSCIDPNLDSIEITPYNNKFYKRPSNDYYKSNFNLLGYVRISGLQFKPTSLCIDSIGCVDPRFCDECFPVELNTQEIADYTLLKPITNIYSKTITMKSKVVTIDFNSIFKNSSNEVESININPNSDVVNLVAYKELPLYSFLTKTNKADIFYISSSVNYEIPNALEYDSSGYTTYVGKIFKKPSTTTTTFNLYGQNLNVLQPLFTKTFDIFAPDVVELPQILNINVSNNIPNYLSTIISMEISTSLEFFTLYTKIKTYSISTQFPYGFSSCTSSKCFYEPFYLIWNKSIASQIFFAVLNEKYNTNTYLLSIDPDTSLPSSIEKFECIHLYDSTFLYRISFNKSTPVSFIQLHGEKFKSDKIVSNDPLTFEIVKDIVTSTSKSFSYSFINDFGRSFEDNSYFLESNKPKLFTSPLKPIFNRDAIKSFKFLEKTMNITNKSVSNKLFIEFYEKVDQNSVFSLVVNDDIQQNERDPKNHFYAKWNKEFELFEIDFIVKANSIQTGYLPFTIHYDYVKSYSIQNSLLLDTDQVNIVSSLFDNRGPIFSKITVSDNMMKIEIQDLVNGFNHGYIVFVGELDHLIYNVSLELSNNLNRSIVSFGISMIKDENCLSQFFKVKEVYLVDTQGYSSYYNNVGEMDPLSNPFFNFLGSDTIHRVYRPCPDRDSSIDQDTTPPILNSFSTSIINNTRYRFDFVYIDNESGLETASSPIVYLKNLDQRIEKCIPSFTIISSAILSYSCIWNVPIDFGAFTVSVYGSLNRNGLVSGCSEVCIEKISSFPYYEPVKVLSPFITSSNFFSNQDTQLWIYGMNLLNCIVQIKYEDENFNTAYTLNPISSFNSVASIPIKKTSKSIYVTFKNSNGNSNQFKATPSRIFDFTQDPLPTNKPKECKNNCGGSNKGYCNIDSGCVCYSPWIGEDCSSQIVIVPQPEVNNTAPSTEIIVNKEKFFKLLTSVVSIRELDINNNLVDQYYFDKWLHNNISSSKNEYTHSLITKSNDIVNVTVTLEWFEESKNITFAEQELLMNPSSMKYTIQLTKYPFKSSLNNLQLLISASISTDPNNDNICSSQEYGQTSTGDNSDYVKIQIDDKSLYGRFIKRGIVDYKIKALSNEFQIEDSRFSSLNNTQHQSQTLIGINIGYYEQFAFLDPNFQVLVDSSSANKDSPNSICKGTSGLTNSQLVGIIVGAGVLFIVLLIIIGNVIYRSQSCLPLKIFIYKLFKKSK